MFKKYNGTEYVDPTILKRYDGTEWVDVSVIKRWDGTEWVEVYQKNVTQADLTNP